MRDLLLGLLSGDRREVLLYAIGAGLLFAGTVLCVVAVRVAVLDVAAVALACTGAVTWVLSNGPGEGSTLVEVRPGNGLTVADMAALPAGLLVCYLSARRVRAPAVRTTAVTGPRTGHDRPE